MKKEIANKWVKALRSGKYKQGQNVLLTLDNKYCCLGVLCELAEQAGVVQREKDSFEARWEFGGDGLELCRKVRKWAGIRTKAADYGTADDSSTLAQDNDTGKTFAEIADIIEREVDNL